MSSSFLVVLFVNPVTTCHCDINLDLTDHVALFCCLARQAVLSNKMVWGGGRQRGLSVTRDVDRQWSQPSKALSQTKPFVELLGQVVHCGLPHCVVALTLTCQVTYSASHYHSVTGRVHIACLPRSDITDKDEKVGYSVST